MLSVTPADLYLNLLKRTLTRFDMGDDRVLVRTKYPAVQRIMEVVSTALGKHNIEINRVRPFDAEVRCEGRDWPADAETMIGLKRLDNIQYCVTSVISDGVPGDLLEAGVWRGGASIFMRGVLMAHGVPDRSVWVADSFQGLPPPDPSVPADSGDKHHTERELAVSLEEVKANFAKYGLLDEQVKFLKGWFSDTLPTAPIGSLAVLRADGDMYGSTMDILMALYPKVASGGFVIIDDYSNLAACRQAVTEYRDRFGIAEPITTIDWTGAYWRKA